MSIKRFLLIAMLLLAGAGSASAQSGGGDAETNAALQEGEWVSYRTVYMQMIRFEKYGKPKHLIQNHFQVSPANKNLSLDGVRLTLVDASTSLNLPLDAAGRAVFPFLKSAYDNNARLVLNRKPNLYVLQPRVSITPRPDGIYEAANLRAACDQVLNYLQYIGKSSLQGKTCVGIRFSYPVNSVDPVVKFRDGNLHTVLAVEEVNAFQDEPTTKYKTVDYRFSDWPEKGQIVTQTASAIISAVFK